MARQFGLVTWTSSTPEVDDDGNPTGNMVDVTRVIYRSSYEEGLAQLEELVALVPDSSGTVEDAEADETNGLIDATTVASTVGGRNQARG